MKSIFSKNILKTIGYLISIFSILILSGCANTNIVKHENFSMPENSKGISIKSPDTANHGNEVPVTLAIGKPLIEGDTLILYADNEEAIQLSTQNSKVNHLSTRLRLTDGVVSVKIIRKSGEIEEKDKKIKIRVSAAPPLPIGNSQAKEKVKTRNEVTKILIKDKMASADHVENITINLTQGAVFIKLTPKISENPYLSIKSSHPYESISIEKKQSSKTYTEKEKNELLKKRAELLEKAKADPYGEQQAERKKREAEYESQKHSSSSSTSSSTPYENPYNKQYRPGIGYKYDDGTPIR